MWKFLLILFCISSVCGTEWLPKNVKFSSHDQPSYSTLRKENEELRKRLKDCTISTKHSLYDSSDYDHIHVDNAGWTRFWWYEGMGWPMDERDVLGGEFGRCHPHAPHCFGRLPSFLKEENAELLAIDSGGNIYRWSFNRLNSTAHAVWNAFYHHLQQNVANRDTWNPKVIAGTPPEGNLNTFAYKHEHDVLSVSLRSYEKCESSISMGYGTCKEAEEHHEVGVRLLFDEACTSHTEQSLSLYFKDNC